MSQSFIGDGMVVGWTEVVSSNSAHVKCMSMQYYIIIVGGFLLALRFPPHNKIESHDIAEILLKVSLNTITLIHIRTNNICFRTSTIWERTARSYAYGSGIYLYICTHCHSLFRLWVRFSYMVRCTRYILYYEAILITVVLELLPLFWYVAHQKRENNFEFWSNFKYIDNDVE
jgi:hypothetical protein